MTRFLSKYRLFLPILVQIYCGEFALAAGTQSTDRGLPFSLTEVDVLSSAEEATAFALTVGIETMPGSRSG